MIIKILGTGCPTCVGLQKAVEDAVKKLEIDGKIIKIDDAQEIADYDIVELPALVIDDVLVLAGGVPSTEDMLAILQHFQSHPGCCCGEDEDEDEDEDDEDYEDDECDNHDHTCCGSGGCGTDGECCGGSHCK